MARLVPVLLSLAVATVMISSPRPAEAGRLAACLAKAFQEQFVERAAANFQGRKLKLDQVLPDGTRVPFEVQIGERLGGGVFGNVYIVDGISNPALTGVDAGIQVAIKFPHSVGGIFEFLGPPGITKNAIISEASSTKMISDQLEKIQESKLFPKDPAWKKGSLPLLPITAKLETKTSGTLLFKPLLSKDKAKFLKDIKSLTPEMEAGLKDVYDLVQAIHGEVKVGKGAAAGFSSDIRPPNFAWVENPEMLRVLGYEKPGWVLFELDQVKANVPQYIATSGYTFEKFKAEFVSYLPKK